MRKMKYLFFIAVLSLCLAACGGNDYPEIPEDDGIIDNLVIGGVIGVIGSIYYFVAIRNFVMENKATFESLDNDK